MRILLEHISKRFLQNWIFKDINFTFSGTGTYAILGPNGSGKSTLLRIVAGMQNPSKGKVHFNINDAEIELNSIYPYISFCAPGMEIIEEFTLREFLDFHFSFKKPLSGLTVSAIIDLINMKDAADKPIADYSSGMKQRVKLAQAIFADTPLLLLDEPCTNLDHAGVEQYREWIETYGKDRMIIVASNDVREYYFCREQIVMEDYK